MEIQPSGSTKKVEIDMNRLPRLFVIMMLVIFIIPIAETGYPLADISSEGDLRPASFRREAGRDAYVPNEILVRFAETPDLQNVLERNGMESTSLSRLHSIKPVVSNFKKKYAIDRDSKGWYSFLGKKYESAGDIADETIFTEAYGSMTEEARRVYRTYKISLPDGVSMRDALADLRGDPDVEFAEPNYKVRALFTPDDPIYPEQWALQEIRAEGAWDITEGDPGIIIAIIDTGIDYKHPDLADNMWRNPDEIPGNGIDDDKNGYVDDVFGYDFLNDDSDPSDDHGHGTHCAGIAAARGDNGIGIIGVAPRASLMAVKFIGRGGEGTVEDAVKAIIYAADSGARILSNSWGSSEYSQALQDVIDYAVNSESECFIAASAGNDSSPAVNYPAGNNHVFSVAATGRNREFFPISSYGSSVDAAAPGKSILSTAPTSIVSGGYALLSGTSMACPHVAGQAALLLSLNPGLAPQEIENIIRCSASKDIFSWEYIGAGVIDLNASLCLKRIPSSSAVIKSPEYNYTATKHNPTVTIRGTAIGRRYNLYCSDSVNPYDASWRRIASGRQARNGILGRFNLSALANGAYFILLEAKDNYGYKLTHMTKVYYDRFLASGWPQETAEKDLFVESLALGDVDGDGSLEVVTGAGWFLCPGPIHIWNYDGTELAGWEGGKRTEGTISTGPALANLDPDYPGLEVIIASHDWRVHAWHADGTYVDGWPQRSHARYFGDFSTTPAVGDFDSNPYNGLEVIAHDNNGTIYAWHADGTPVDGWPRFSKVNATPVIADMDQDKTDGPELVFVRNDKTLGPEVCAVHVDGTGVDGWPISLGGNEYDIYASPLVADIDPAYPGAEIVVVASKRYVAEEKTRHGIVYAFHSDGTTVSDWPARIEGKRTVFDSAVAAADVDLDGDTEIFLAGRDSCVYALHHDGTALEGWPRGPVSNNAAYDFLSSPIIVNLDGNLANGLEVVIGSANGNMYAWHADGSLVDEFPLRCTYGIWTSAVTGDMNNDGTVELAVGTGDGKVYVWSLPGSETEISDWPTYKNNNMRTGISQAPRIDTVSPDIARVTDRFTIEGLNLNGPNLRVVLSNNAKSKDANVLMAYPERLICRVPKSLTEGVYKLKVITDFGTSNAVRFEVKVNTVKGRVVDSRRRKGISGAYITLKPSTYGYGLRDYKVKTDRNGYFRIKDITGSTYTSGGAQYWANYTLHVSRQGYKSYKSGTINFKNRSEYRFNIKLKPQGRSSRKRR